MQPTATDTATDTAATSTAAITGMQAMIPPGMMQAGMMVPPGTVPGGMIPPGMAPGGMVPPGMIPPPPPGRAPAGMMQQAGVQTVDPNLLLSLARDNKAADLIRLIRQQGVPVNLGNKMGQTALHVASLWGNADAIRVLIQLGANPNATNMRGSTPLHFAAAAKQNALAVCQLLIASGANPGQPDFHGYLPYEQAEQPEVRVLLGGPDQRLFDYAEEGRVDELQQLVASGVVNSLKVVDGDGHHVLNIAVKNKQDKVVQLLLNMDPELAILPDMTANTPLHWAAETGNTALVQQLLKSKPQLDMQNLNMCDYSTGQWVVGDDPIMPVDKTPLHLAVDAGAVDIVRLLLAAGANPNLLDYDGASPLHLAMQEQDAEMLEVLLQGGANPSQPNKDVTSALHAAAQRGPLKLMQLLLDHKAEVGLADAKGWTPLHLAARVGAAAKVECLLAAGAKASDVNSQGNTPLHLASVNGHSKVVQQLLAAGADPQAQNKEKRTAVDMAKTPELAQLLQAHKASS